MLKVDVLSIFPQMFYGPFDNSMIKIARDRGLLSINVHDIRDFTLDKHSMVDDAPYGGGPGMVMKAQPILDAVRFVQCSNNCGEILVMPSPQGRVFNQGMAEEISHIRHLILICCHYEGPDERVQEILPVREVSIGDYILTGGELPAMVIVDAVARLIPGVLGHSESAVQDSFYNGLLDHPHYTRPRDVENNHVPEVLLSGDHERIRKWRRKQSLLRTLERRPELFQDIELTKEDWDLLNEIEEDREDLQYIIEYITE